VLHDREIEVALTMARIEPLSTQPGPEATKALESPFDEMFVHGLFDYLVSDRQYFIWDGEAERRGGTMPFFEFTSPDRQVHRVEGPAVSAFRPRASKL
jgi:hypothetical protein